MKKFSNTIYTSISALFLLFALLSCTSHSKNIISQDKMAKIIADMYLADQYIEINPELTPAMDSVRLYDAVMEKYGRSFSDYEMSVSYYLMHDDKMQRIYRMAKEILIRQKDHLSKLIAKSNNDIREWWATDSIVLKNVNDLWKEPYLRIVNALLFSGKRPDWNFTDTLVFDTPLHPVWWLRNSGSPLQKDTLYPILLRDCMIARDVQEKNGKLQESGKNKKKRGPEKRPDGELKIKHGIWIEQ